MQLPNLATQLLTVGAVLLAACEKEAADNPSGPSSYFLDTVHVSEAVTGFPIAGAKVTLSKCSKYDNEFGCVGFGPVATFTTDTNGHAVYDDAISWDRVSVNRDNYWPVNLGRTRTPRMYPIGYLQVRLVKSSPLPPDKAVYVAVKGPPCSLWCYYDFTRVGQPADTTIYLKAFGNIQNSVLWDIRSPDSAFMVVNVQQTAPVLVNRFDTAPLTIHY